MYYICEGTERRSDPMPEVIIDGHDCLVVDEWVAGDNSFVLGVNKKDSSFYHAAVNGKDCFEYDCEPARKEVESDFDDLEARRRFDEYDTEFGADGRRVFPHLNDDIADDTVASSTDKMIACVAEKIHDFLWEYDPAFGYAESMPGQENKEQCIDTISKDLMQNKANLYVEHIMSLVNEKCNFSQDANELLSDIKSCEKSLKAEFKKKPLDEKITSAHDRVVVGKSSSDKSEKETER